MRGVSRAKICEWPLFGAGAEDDEDEPGDENCYGDGYGDLRGFVFFNGGGDGTDFGNFVVLLILE